MKIFFLPFVLSCLLLISCKKEAEPSMTSFQLLFTDYYTKDTLPNINFNLIGASNSSYNFYGSTNEYGNFDTIFSHVVTTDFYIRDTEADHYYKQVSGYGDIKGGTNTALSIPLLSVGTVEIYYDCSGGGFIQEVFLYRSQASPDTFPDPSSNYATTATLYENCTASSVRSVYSGMWVVQYDYKMNSSSQWETMYDTLEVLPGQTTQHTIVY